MVSMHQVVEWTKLVLIVMLLTVLSVMILSFFYGDAPDTEVCVGSDRVNVHVPHGSTLVYIDCPKRKHS